MRNFFSQFGEVTRVRVSRNAKTKRSKGYGFVEFRVPEVADVVAEAFNGYMMFGRTIVAKRIPKEKVHENTFLGSNRPLKDILRPKNNRREEMKAREAPKSKEQNDRRITRLVARERRLREKLKESGVEYDFVGYEQQQGSKPKRTVFE